MFVDLATTPSSAVLVIGEPRILIAISVAGTVQTLPFTTLRRSFRAAGSSFELIIIQSSSRFNPAVTGTVFSKVLSSTTTTSGS